MNRNEQLARRIKTLQDALHETLNERSNPYWWRNPFPGGYMRRIDRLMTLTNKAQKKLLELYRREDWLKEQVRAERSL